jgi:hypothetical protein
MSGGAELLDEVATFVRRYVVLSAVQLVAAALWIAHTWSFDAADTTPYIGVTSAEKRSGKTRFLEVVELLVRQPLPTANISDAALFRAIGELTPTLLLDEIDAVFSPKARDREDLRGMLNAGYRRGAVARRCGGPKMTTLESFPVFAPKAFAGIGDLPDTIADRSIRIRLERRTREETIERFRRREAEPVASALRERLEAWCEPQIEALHGLWPMLPDELDDRAQDVWEPLLALAMIAGGDWPERARLAAVELSSAEGREDDSLTARLLSDVHQVFEASGERRFRTGDLIEKLAEIEESPWGDWQGGKAISSQGLSKLLHPHRIKTMPVWVDGQTVRGYKREQFEDAWLRVLGVRGDRSVRPGSASGNAPNEANVPNAQGTMDGPRVGDPLYAQLLVEANGHGHITDAELAERLALHALVEGAR